MFSLVWEIYFFTFEESWAITMLENIIISLIASLIVAAVSGVIIYIWKNRRIIKFFTCLKLFINIFKSGMTYFYCNKDMLRRQIGTIGEEIGQTKKKFIYIGYTMSDIIRQDMEEAVLKAINEKDIHFEFCILDEGATCTGLYAEYTGRDIEEIKHSLKDIDKKIKKIKKKLPDDKKEYIKLLRHNLFIPSSCFLRDIEEETGWIHFNYKAPRAIKFQDFGFVLSNNKKSEFYNNMKNSYLSILEDIYTYNNH